MQRTLQQVVDKRISFLEEQINSGTSQKKTKPFNFRSKRLDLLLTPVILKKKLKPSLQKRRHYGRIVTMSMNSIAFLQNWRGWSGCNNKYQDSFGDKTRNKPSLLLLQHMWQETKEVQKKKNNSKPTIVMLAVYDT